jgi:hypothetical protein
METVSSFLTPGETGSGALKHPRIRASARSASYTLNLGADAAGVGARCDIRSIYTPIPGEEAKPCGYFPHVCLLPRGGWHRVLL